MIGDKEPANCPYGHRSKQPPIVKKIVNLKIKKNCTKKISDEEYVIIYYNYLVESKN